MAPLTSITEIRFNNLVTYLTVAASTLSDLEDALGTPFLRTISKTTASLLDSVQSAKSKREECVQFLEQIHAILFAIISLHVTSNTGGILAPETLNHIGKFNETLQKIRVFVESQQGGNRIKRFLRQSETSSLLKDCNLGLQQALDVFKIHSGATILDDMGNMQHNLDQRHEKLLDLIAMMSDGSNSDKLSTVNGSLLGSLESSNSLSLLPGKPKIFHGRETELDHIIKTLTGDSARIAILGAGGMGKTSLAKAALHHPGIAVRYTEHFFITSDAITTSSDVVGLVAAHLGIEPGKNTTMKIVDYFSNSPSCLLILDNLETIWEPLESRTGVEEFLSLLACVPQLALIITMRGAERPGKVQWTHPFLPPLKPLSDDAAHAMLSDIVEGFHDPKDIKKLLGFTDNVPLAVDLLAHLVDYEGCPTVLSRWETERTSMLSDGSDKRANLDISISLSLSSPRMLALPSARELLSLLSILPDGLSEIDLLQSHLPIKDIPACRTTLLRTSLAYVDDDGHLKAPSLIRQYMVQADPPSLALVYPILKHFHQLLKFCTNYMGSLPSAKVITCLTSNLGNIESVLLSEFQSDDTGVIMTDVIECTLYLNDFRRFSGRDRSDLMNYIPDALSKIQDPRLWTIFITDVFNSWNSNMTFLAGRSEMLVAEAQQQFTKFNDPGAKAKFYNGVGYFYLEHNKDPANAKTFFETAISLAKSGSKSQECYALVQLSWIQRSASNYQAAVVYAREAQKVAELSGNLLQEARALRVEAALCHDLGLFNDGLQHCLKGRELVKLCGLSGSVVDLSLLNTMGHIHFTKSEYAESRSISANIIHDVDQSQYSYPLGLHSVACNDVLMGTNDAEVQHNLDKAYAIFSAMGDTSSIRHCDILRAELNLRQGNLVDAKALFQQCYDASLGKDFSTLYLCLEKLGDLTCWGPRKIYSIPSWTIVFLAQALKLHQKLQIHQALRCLGDVFLNHDELETALSIFTVALEGFEQMDIHRSKGECMLRLGEISCRNGDFNKAAEFYRGALPLFERSSQAKSVSEIHSRLVTIQQSTEDVEQQNEAFERELEKELLLPNSAIKERVLVATS